MSKIIDDFKVFEDKYGLTALNPGETSDNGALFTVEYLLTLLADSTSTDAEKQAEIARVMSVLKSLEPQPGLTVRSPGDTAFESMDNTVAFLTSSGLFDAGRFGARLEARGNTRMTGPDETQDSANNNKLWPWLNALSLWRGPNHIWNNQNPELFCLQGWWGRSPAMLGLMKMVQGETVSPFLWLAVLVGQFLGCNADESNTDARKLPYVTWQFLKNRSWFWKWAYKVWVWTLMRKCPNGMKSVYDTYYQNPDHPMHTYAKPYID